MTRLRETANYKNARFPDPLVPKSFEMLDVNGVDVALIAYRNDADHLFTFDSDHAAVAFPMECIKQARRALNRAGLDCDDEDLDYIRTCSKRVGIDPDSLL